jgi:hypothetical protein
MVLPPHIAASVGSLDDKTFTSDQHIPTTHEHYVKVTPTFPYQLLLCFRIKYHFGPINGPRALRQGEPSGKSPFRIKYHFVSVSTITMALSTITCRAAVSTSAALAVDLSTRTAIGIAFPYQLLLCFRINYYYDPISSYLQRGGEHFGGASSRLVDQDSDRDGLLAPLPLGAVLGPLPVSA